MSIFWLALRVLKNRTSAYAPLLNSVVSWGRTATWGDSRWFNFLTPALRVVTLSSNNDRLNGYLYESHNRPPWCRHPCRRRHGYDFIYGGVDIDPSGLLWFPCLRICGDVPLISITVDSICYDTIEFINTNQWNRSNIRRLQAISLYLRPARSTICKHPTLLRLSRRTSSVINVIRKYQLLKDMSTCLELYRFCHEVKDVLRYPWAVVQSSLIVHVYDAWIWHWYTLQQFIRIRTQNSFKHQWFFVLVPEIGLRARHKKRLPEEHLVE